MSERRNRATRLAARIALALSIVVSRSLPAAAQSAATNEGRTKHTIAILTESFGAPKDVSLALTDRVRQVAERTGYVALTPDVTLPVLAALAPEAGPMTAARLLDITRRLRAERGVVVSIRLTASGRFDLEVQVASGDGAGPWSARGSAAQPELGAAAEQLTSSILPPPAATPRVLETAVAASPTQTVPAKTSATPNELHAFRLAIATESAFGLSGSGFYNHLAGARLDRRFTRQVSLGAYVGYVNLKGKAGRAHNVLPYALFEWRPTLAGSLSLPLRYATGYLPKNGPVLRASAGLGWEFNDDVELTLELLTPTLWVTHDETVVSLDLAAELGFTF